MRNPVAALAFRGRRRPVRDNGIDAVIASVARRHFPKGSVGPGGAFPYSEITAAQMAAYRHAAAQSAPQPAYHPAQGAAPETRPMPVISAGAPGGTLDMPEVLALRRLLDGIKGIDGKALDAARSQEGLTYARTSGAPFHNALLARWRSPVRPAHRHGEAATRRAEALAYPSYDVTEAAGHGAYAAVMRHADLITGTRGTGRWLPALPAGGAR